MSNLEAPFVEKGWKRRAGAVVASGMIALSGAAELTSPASAEAKVKDPVTTYLEKQHRAIDEMMQVDLASGRRGFSKKELNFGGNALSIRAGKRVVDPVTGKVSYDQFVEYKRPDQDIPFIEIIVHGAPTRKYSYKENSDSMSMKILTRDESNPDNWSEEDLRRDPSGHLVDNRFFKRGGTYTVAIDGASEVPIGSGIVLRNFDSFTDEAKSIINKKDQKLSAPAA
jgi:hypothetical protein